MVDKDKDVTNTTVVYLKSLIVVGGHPLSASDQALSPPYLGPEIYLFILVDISQSCLAVRFLRYEIKKGTEGGVVDMQFLTNISLPSPSWHQTTVVCIFL